MSQSINISSRPASAEVDSSPAPHDAPPDSVNTSRAESLSSPAQRTVHDSKSGRSLWDRKLKGQIQSLFQKLPAPSKTFSGTSNALLSSLEQDNVHIDEGERHKLLDLSEAIDRKLQDFAKTSKSLSAAQIDEKVKEIDEERAQWRGTFINLLEKAKLESPKPQKITNRAGETYELVPAPELTRLTFKGGGAKGQAYAGAMSLLDASGKLAHVREVAGSSAGAITASLVACGADFREIGRNAITEDMNKIILAKPGENSAIPTYQSDPDLRLGMAPSRFLKSGNGLIDYLDSNLKGALLKKIDGLEIDRLHPAERKDLQQIKTDLEASNKGPTFGQLATLADAAPDSFKHLHVTAYNMRDKQLIYFSSQKPEHYDVPISIAVRASAGFPAKFKTVALELDNTRMELKDGGLKSNIPIEALFPNQEKDYLDHLKNPESVTSETREVIERENLQTLVLAFDDGGTTHKKMHAPKKESDAISKSFPGVGKLFGNPNMSKDWRADTAKANSLASNVLVLGHGDLQTASFSASAPRRLAAQVEGELDSAQFLIDRSRQAIAVRT